MEKLMTTFAKTKKDIIKDALKEATKTIVLENKKIKAPSSKAKKTQNSQSRNNVSIPWQKSHQSLLNEFHQSCDVLKNMISTGFHNIYLLVTQKQKISVNKVKDDLLLYIKNHRLLDHILITPSLDKNKTDLPWQKHKIELSEDFLESCNNLENLLVTSFDKLFEVVSQKYKETLEVLKQDLLNYLNKYHRNFKPHKASLSTTTVKKKTSKKKVSKTIPKKPLSEKEKKEKDEDAISPDPVPEMAPIENTPEIVVPSNQ